MLEEAPHEELGRRSHSQGRRMQVQLLVKSLQVSCRSEFHQHRKAIHIPYRTKKPNVEDASPAL